MSEMSGATQELGDGRRDPVWQTAMVQAQVAEAVAVRGYRDDWSPEQFLARQMAKMAEELAECNANIKAETGTALRDALAKAGFSGQLAFDYGDWLGVEVLNLDAVRSELADMAVVLLCMADAVEELAGEEFDVIAVAAEKATADVERGVR